MRSFILLAALLLTALPAQADRAYNKFGKALEETLKVEEDGERRALIEELEAKYRDRFVRGSGYVMEVEDRWGDVIVFTKAERVEKPGTGSGKVQYDYTGAQSKIYVEREDREKARALKRGQKVYFFGYFRDIMKGMIIVRKAKITE
ncbi:MAG: hypothetical protein ABIJ27_07265 [Candidatus Omnitrophota bacterium]